MDWGLGEQRGWKRGSRSEIDEEIQQWTAAGLPRDNSKENKALSR